MDLGLRGKAAVVSGSTAGPTSLVAAFPSSRGALRSLWRADIHAVAVAVCRTREMFPGDRQEVEGASPLR